MSQVGICEKFEGNWKVVNVIFLTTTVEASQIKFRRNCIKSTIHISATKLKNTPCNKCFVPCEFNGFLVLGDTSIEKKDAINNYESKAINVFFEKQETSIRVFYTNYPIGVSDDKLQIIELNDGQVLLYTGGELIIIKKVNRVVSTR